MTKFGKIFVLVNVAFSFTMLAWAMALYANRIDWTDKGEGELKKRIDKIKDLQAALPNAQTAWRDTRAGVLRLEVRRPADRIWYARELQHLRKPADGNANRPARFVVFERGVPALDPATGLPRLADATGPMNQPLLSLDHYQREMADVLAKTKAETDRYDAAIKSDIELTNRLAGDPDPTKKKIGLQLQLVNERQKYDGLMKEQEFIRPQLINAFVESQLVLRRAESLKERIRELEGIGVARGE